MMVLLLFTTIIATSRSRASIKISRVDMDQEHFASVSKSGASALRTRQGNDLWL